MIEARGLSKAYGGNRVLRGIDLSVRPGEFLVILGQSGAGKSTLLRCMNRLVDADAGSLTVAGHDVSSKVDLRALRRHVAMIFQHQHVVPRLSVLKNVLAGRLGAVSSWMSVLQWFSKRDVALAAECLARVGLAGLEKMRADALSGGQMQRVGIARALAQQPRVILADEPVASLDPHNAEQVLTCLREVCRELGITVVCNLHQVDYAKRFADRIVGMAQGTVVFDGRPADLGGGELQRIYCQVDDPGIVLPATARGEPVLATLHASV
jgi:phosphonate transport system ATP-binding protein